VIVQNQKNQKIERSTMFSLMVLLL